MKTNLEMTKIYSVDGLALEWRKTNPPQLVIKANGTTTTSGWTNIMLSQRIYIEPPADGYQEFDIIGVPPSGLVPQVLTPVIAAPFIMNVVPGWLKGVRVYAATNEMEAKS